MNAPRKLYRSARQQVSRREFLRYTASAGALAAAAPALPGLSTARRALPAQQFEFGEATIAELQAAMEAGRQTSRRLVQAFIDRIKGIDLAGLQLNSVIEINPDALEIADRLDRERQSKGPRGPLHGIPVLIKENIATADRMETTAGSFALLGSRPPRDSFMASRLRE
ncbi:MAG: amidase family protein, partial [Acidimicrobiia bacterium]